MSQNPDKTFRVGLTGGIASGKSTVADMFAELGVPVIDTDVIARQVVEPGQPALAEIRQQFGGDVIAADGTLDRAAMRRTIFADDNARQQLEAILHPIIRDEAMRQSRAAGGDYQLIVVPLLVESPMRHAMDRILVVDCAVDVQIERLLERDAETESQARKIVAAQASREARLAIADDVVRNDGSLDETGQQVDALHAHYLALSANGDS